MAFGQLEAPISDRGTPTLVLSSSPARLPTHNISALTRKGAGFDVMSFACNHAMDYSWDAFYDTLDIADKNNIAIVGAGRNIDEARRPSILEEKGTRIGFLAYLSIDAIALPAQKDKPGCVPLRSTTAYMPVHPFPGTPPLVVTKLYPQDKKAMEEDIKKLRPQVDVLVVSMHCGVHLMPAIIAMYQKEAAYAAIDAGADLILQHHAHILKGIEVYKGKVVFYGLNHFAIEHHLPFPGRLKSWEDDFRAEFRKQICRIKPDPGYEKHIFHHDALKTMIAKAYIQDKKIQKVTYIPAYINPNMEPEVVTRKQPKGRDVFKYVRQITDSEELRADFSWDGDEVLISESTVPPTGLVNLNWWAEKLPAVQP